MPCSYIGGKVPKLIVQDVFRNIPRYYCEKKNITVVEFRSHIFLSERRAPNPLDYKHMYYTHKRSKSLSADHLPDWNLSLYITECGSLEKFEILLEKCKLKERRKFFLNISCIIFMK